jgi:methylthioribose-1-phosphate isomerase
VSAPVAARAAPVAIDWDGQRLHALDQTLLPAREVWLELDGPTAVVDAIARLAVRGAPLLGVVGGYGMAMAAAAAGSDDELRGHAAALAGARPTAVNLPRAVDRVLAQALAAAPAQRARVARAEAEAIDAENVAAGQALAECGADLLVGAHRLLTHCNTGVLACGSRASALGLVAALAERGRDVSVLVCETRPLLQGARLTTWELARMGVAHELIVDAAAPGLIRAGQVDAVVTGFDRAAANGDVANKVGTYGLALAAAAAGVPLVVAGPCASIDLSLPGGDAIAIEQRDADEVRRAMGEPTAPAGTSCRNPAFDVTPGSLITALVTERGVAQPVNAATLAALTA